MDISTIRRERLRLLKDERFQGKQVLLASAIGRQPDYISRCLKGMKNIGETLARDIEVKVGLPHAWLDQPIGAALPAPTLAPAAERTFKDLLDEFATALQSAAPEVRSAVMQLTLKYSEDPEHNANIAAAIEQLLHPPKP